VPTWNYDRCSAQGPANWPGGCSTEMSASPINLCGAIPLPMPIILSLNSYDMPLEMTVQNTGRNILLTVTNSPPPSLQAGNIAAVVGLGPNVVDTWNLGYVQAHWGRIGQGLEGSEHYLEGKPTSLELQLLHYNSRYSNWTQAVASGQPDALLGVAVFFMALLQPEAPFMREYGIAATTATLDPMWVNTTMMASDIFNGQGDFYAYPGSTTAPPCLSSVTWIVMKTVRTVAVTTMDIFRNVSANPPSPSPGISQFGNFRPLQNLGARVVYQSGGSTSNCNSPKLPVFSCSGALPSAVSSLSTGLTALGLAAWWLLRS